MPPRARRPWLRRLLVLAGLGGAVAWWVQSDFVMRMAARTGERAAEALLGERVSVGRVRLSYVPLEFGVDGLVIAHPATGDTIVAAHAITVTPGWEHGHPIVRRLTLDRPLVELHVEADGQLRELRALTATKPSLPEPPLSTGPAHLPWEELEILDGTFLLHAPTVDVAVGGIALTPTGPEGRGDLALASVTLGLPNGRQEARDLRFPGLRLAADAVEIPSLDVQFPAFGVEGWARLPAEGPIDGELSARVELGRLTAPVEPLSAWQDGVIDVDATLGGTRAEPAATGRVAASGITLWQRDRDHMKAISFGDVAGPWTLTPSPYRLDLDHAQMTWGPGTLDVTASVGLEDKTVSGGVLAEGVSLAEILRSVGVAPTPWVDFTGDVETHVTGTWSPLMLTGPFEVDLVRLEVGDGPVHKPHDTLLAIPRGSIGGDLEITADHLVLDGREVRAGPSRGSAHADIGFGFYGPLVVDVDLPVVDLSWLAPLGDLELAGTGAVRGRLGGPYNALRVEGDVTATGFEVLGLPIADTLTARVWSDMKQLGFDDIDARVGDTSWTGRYMIDFSREQYMDAQVAIPRGRIRDLTGIFVDLEGLDGDASGTMALTGTPYRLSGDTHLALGDVDLYGERFPTGDALGTMVDGELDLHHVSLMRPGDTSPVSLDAHGWVRRGWLLDIDVVSHGLTLEGLDHLAGSGLPVSAKLELGGHVGGTLFDWQPSGELRVRDTRYAGEPLPDTSFSFDTVYLADGVPALSYRGGVFGDAARVAGTVGFYDTQPYRLQAELEAFPLQFFHPRGEDGSPITATLTGSLDLGGELGDNPTPVDIEGNFRAVRLAWAGHELVNQGGQPWRFSVHDKEVSIPQLTLQGNDDTLLWLTGKVGEGGDVELDGGGTVNVDLGRAVAPGIVEADGLAQVDLRMRSSDAGPEITVTADLMGPTIRTEYWPEAFEDLRGRIVARADGYTFTGVEAVVGGGLLRGLPSRIDAEGWVPRRYDLRAAIEGTRTHYIDYLPPVTGEGTLAFSGPASDPLLSGRLAITAMDFRDRIDWEGMVLSLREERLTAAAPEARERYFSMDLQITADDTVSLRNNVADADGSADLRIVGDTARPGMIGTIRLDPGGRVYLHEREFELTRGELRYLDPYTFDPDLDILLETDIRGSEQEYHVTYAVTGLFSDWRTTTSADPYLSQSDINAYLLFGVTREELEKYGGQALGTAIVAETGDLLLGQTALTRANVIIDRWNLVSGVSERGSSTVSSELRLVAEKQLGDFDLTMETTLGQSFGQDWYLSVERRIARRMYATMYAATRQEGRSLPIGAAYGAEFKLRWELD